MGSLDVGSVVADTYEVTRLIGRGGMGEVWLAGHRRLPGKQVAIKVLHLGGKQLSPDALARFKREAEVATRINHPNIVEVHDFNTLPDGAPYVVLEFLQGESLASRLRHPMAVEDVQRILRQVGSALQAAHAHGVVHRDLKPDNIFIVTSAMGETVKVLDFGISKVVDSTTLQTQEAVLVGTPAYMSPEQATGANKDVGPQSDVFALGAIAYEMLSGQQPFAAESVAQLVFKIAYEPHVPLAQRKADLPPRVVQAVERALMKDRAQRFPDVAAFIEALTGAPLPAIHNKPIEVSYGRSGVATPGMDSPSLMMGKTAAPTGPATPQRAPTAAPVPAPLPATGRRWWIPALAGLACLAIALFAYRHRPRMNGDAMAGPTVPAEPKQVTALDSMAKELPPAPKEAEAPPPPVVVDAGADAPKPARAKFAIPPVEDAMKVAELSALVKAEKFLEAVQAADRAKRQDLTPLGASYAAMLSTQAYCGRKDQGGAQAHYRTITNATHRDAAKAFCAKYIDVTLLSF